MKNLKKKSIKKTNIIYKNLKQCNKKEKITKQIKNNKGVIE